MKILAWLILAAAVSAEDKGSAPATSPATAASATAPGAPITYELRDLRPAGFTQHVGVGDAVRQYFDFQNDQGGHHVIYEEVASAPPSRTVPALRQAAVSYESLCSMDLECTSKAFCTGDCKHMYYETANAPGDSLAPDRNKCRVLYFTCEKAGSPVPSRAPGS